MAKKVVKLAKPSRRKIHLGIIVSQFNDYVTKRLLNGCLSELDRQGIKDQERTVVWVPGCFEIPLVALKLAQRKNIDGVICLGAVIRGETSHYDLVAENCARGVLDVGLTTSKPVIFGVLTTDTVDQAHKRSEPKGDNKGRDAAVAVLKMIDLLSHIQ